MRGATESEIECDAQVAAGGHHGAEVVFVVAAGDRQLADGLEHVRTTIAIGVGEAGEFLALGDVIAALGRDDDAEWFVQAGGEKRETRLRRRVVGAIDPPDFTAACGDQEAFAGQRKDAADLEHDVGWRGQ